MCKTHLHAKKAINPEADTLYGIGLSRRGFGALHPLRELPANCTVCINDGARLILSNVPKVLQEEHDIGEVQTVTFIETGENFENFLGLPDGNMVPVRDFANRGIRVHFQGVDVSTVDVGGAMNGVGVMTPAGDNAAA